MAASRTEDEWLAAIRATSLGGDWGTADALCARARAEYPQSVNLCRLQAGLSQHMGRAGAAETLFRQVLATDPGDTAAAWDLARLCGQQGRTAAAARVVRTCMLASHNRQRADLAISAIELLDDYARKADAAAIADAAVAANPADARLHAYAGMLQMQLGEFEAARSHYLYALANDARAWEWHIPPGLANAQRYANAAHPDFNLFDSGLQRPGLSDAARAEVHFALAKANDDVGRYSEAANHLRQGNRTMHRLVAWPRKAWSRSIQARLAAGVPLLNARVRVDFVPIFIVGMPRSGTTLLATLLANTAPRILSRGELPWIERVVQHLVAGRCTAAEIEQAAATYEAQVRQDDAGDAHWFIDKQPLNFRYVDLILALFPNARIIHCQRSARDTALSLWLQCFTHGAQGYAYDFGDIARVMDDEARLMAHWQARYPDAVRDVRYEDLVAAPATVVAELGAWIGFSSADAETDTGAPKSPQALATSSLWQARQPVYTRAIGRWQHYATDIPELLRFKA